MNSLSAIERANPPPRRKSCQACIKAKRRCDLGQPACLRCTQRLLECQYSSAVSAARRINAASTGKQRPLAAGSMSTPPSALQRQEGTESTGETEYNNMLFTDPLPMENPAPDAEFDFFDTELDMLQFLNDPPTETQEENTDLSSCAPVFTVPRPPSPSYNKLDLILHIKENLALALQPEGTRGTTPLSFTLTHRLQYSIDLVKDAPRRMVVDLQTPWSHPELYRDNMPRSMQGRPISYDSFAHPLLSGHRLIVRSLPD